MKQKLLLLSILLIAPLATCGASCTASGTTLAFGTYTGTQLTPTNVVTTNCTVTPSTVELNAGTGSGATTTTRVMTGPSGATLNYTIYQNSTHTTIWGNTVGTNTVSITGTGSKTTTAYGLMAANQAPTPGTYTDTITISVVSSAGTQTGNFSVTATVSAYCSISATSMAFGTYTGAVLNATSSVNATCTNTTAYNLSLSVGTATGATVSNRSMTGPSSNLLGYALYSNSGMTSIWGNTIGTNTVVGKGIGSQQTVTVYGQIPAGQYKVPGSYSDTITATVTY
jgi:spore coat protein U-like protein